MAKPDYDPARHRRWLNAHAIRRTCPPCAGRRRPQPEADSIVQHSMICPRCSRVWVYRTQIERRVKERRPTCWFPQQQPFIKET